MNKTLVTGIVFGTILGVSSFASATSISYVGNDLTTNDAWRTTDVVKPLDADGDNIYGTDGYYLYPGISSVPSYVSMQDGPGMKYYPGNNSYIQLDQRNTSGSGPIANEMSGVFYTQPGTNNPTDFFTITLTTDADFRLGIITDNADYTAIAPLDFRLRQTSGGLADTGYNLASSDRDRDGDYYFFDISGAAGDAFILSGRNDGSFASNGIYGVTFDSVPEPSAMLLFGSGIAGLAGIRIRRRKNKK